MDGLDLALADEALHEQRRMHDVMACCCGEFDDPELPDHGCVLAAEVARLRAERDRLADGIREHRDYEFPEGSFTPTERFSQALRASERLWSLLDVAGDDREDG